MKKTIAMVVGLAMLTGCTVNQQAPEHTPTTEQTPGMEPTPQATAEPTPEATHAIVIPEGDTIATRFAPPKGYQRTEVAEDSFGAYLRNQELKPHGSKVHYYDGRVKERSGVYLAVLDVDVGERDLQQCADAVMRLWAEYNLQKEDYDAIHFNFTNGFRVDYSKWRRGYRVKVSGNDCSYVKSASPSDTYESFRRYMDIIFSYAGTLSLSRELKDIDIMDMKIGDVLIKGGSPGHAVIVVDMAKNPETGEKCYMLAQSYMPAQEIQILCNPSNLEIPWYNLEEVETIRTPEWSFTSDQLMRFEP